MKTRCVGKSKGIIPQLGETHSGWRIEGKLMAAIVILYGVGRGMVLEVLKSCPFWINVFLWILDNRRELINFIDRHKNDV